MDAASRPPARLLGALCALLSVVAFAACEFRSSPFGATRVEPFNFQVAAGKDQFQIEGYLARTSEPGRHPALLVIDTTAEGDARRCIEDSAHLSDDLGMQVACISIPGYGNSSGPSRFVGPPAVVAARRALDLLASRKDVDSSRLGVWGLQNGAVVAGLVMDSDPRPRAVVLQSGAYDMLKFWPEAPLLTKIRILHEVWPSRRVLKERSVIEHLPAKLECKVLIIHGEKDHRMPVRQARRLEQALKARGTQVQAYYVPRGSHYLGGRVEQPLESFLRDSLVAIN